LLQKEQRGKFKDLLQVHIFFAIELLIFTDAVLKLPNLVSQALNILSNLFDLSTVLDKEPVCIDHRLNYHRCEYLNCVIVLELQAIHLNADHLRQLLNPLSLYGLSSLIVRCKVVIYLILIQIFPSLVHVFSLKYAQHHLVKGIRDLLKLIFTLRSTILNESLNFSEKCITNNTSLFLCLLSLRFLTIRNVGLNDATKMSFDK